MGGSLFVVKFLSLPVCRNFRWSGIVFRLMKLGQQAYNITRSRVVSFRRKFEEQARKRASLSVLFFISGWSVRRTGTSFILSKRWPEGRAKQRTGDDIALLNSEFGPGCKLPRNPYLLATIGNQVGDKLTTVGVTTREVSCS